MPTETAAEKVHVMAAEVVAVANAAQIVVSELKAPKAKPEHLAKVVAVAKVAQKFVQTVAAKVATKVATSCAMAKPDPHEQNAANVPIVVNNAQSAETARTAEIVPSVVSAQSGQQVTALPVKAAVKVEAKVAMTTALMAKRTLAAMHNQS